MTICIMGSVSLRLLLLTAATVTALWPEIDAREIIRRTVAADQRNWAVARNYEFSERVDLRRLDSRGRVESKEVKSYDVTLIEGSPYRRLSGFDDRPLAGGDEKREQEKLARSTDERRKESATERDRRLLEYDRRPRWQREAWRELPDAFDFKLSADQFWDGHHLYVVEAVPHPGYKPRSFTAKALAHLKATLYVDKRDYHLVKAEVEVIATISAGLFLVRLARGSRASYELAWVNNEVWLPQRIMVFASARLGLLKALRIEQEVVYSNGREFGAAGPRPGVAAQLPLQIPRIPR